MATFWGYSNTPPIHLEGEACVGDWAMWWVYKHNWLRNIVSKMAALPTSQARIHTAWRVCLQAVWYLRHYKEQRVNVTPWSRQSRQNEVFATPSRLVLGLGPDHATASSLVPSHITLSIYNRPLPMKNQLHFMTYSPQNQHLYDSDCQIIALNMRTRNINASFHVPHYIYLYVNCLFLITQLLRSRAF